MPKLSKAPIPKKRYHGGRWRIYWFYKYQQYVVQTDYFGLDDEFMVDQDMRHISSALAQDKPMFPEQYANLPIIEAYLSARYTDRPAKPEIPDNDTILANYDIQFSAEVSKEWAQNSRRRLKALSEAAGGILNVTPKLANEFLTGILTQEGKGKKGREGRTPGTRNRALNAFMRFFKEMKRIGYITENPFEGIKLLKEPHEEEIVYCTIEERARVLAVAELLGGADWIAIPIAFYAGCRRSEVFGLRWEDVNFDTRRLVVRKSKTGRLKTGKSRLTPIAKELFEILQQRRESRGIIVPSVMEETWGNQADRLIEGVREVLCRPENPNLLGKASEAIGKKRFLQTEEDILRSEKAAKKRIEELTPKVIASKKNGVDARKMAIELACLEQVNDKAHDGQPWIPAERINWNAFRHTFATLRAQAGVSLDKISSWMGNTPEVCRKHYAQFMPRDSHDEDIDK